MGELEMTRDEVIGKIFLDTSKGILILIKPRTIFTLLFFGTTAYLMLIEKKVPEILKNIDIALLSFYFGEKSAKYFNGKVNGKENK